jgi:restriction system protein
MKHRKAVEFKKYVVNPEPMTVPAYDQFIEPLLRYLVQQTKGVIAKLADEAAGLAFGLTDKYRQVLLPIGVQSMYKNRAG